jgi:hypothetical protein
MQIDFATSGGVVNQQLRYSADTQTMPEREAQELIRLVDSSGVFDLEPGNAHAEGSVGRTDVISYRLSLSDEDKQTTLWLNEITAPAAVRPLLSFLREKALEQRGARA